ncbi:MAG TPA: TonB-dependent receptor [Hyphomonadaceae bacterium]|nr:TonB-dependent receptor [Ponticaulis sp.]MAJ07896.1 TonB-dependent receptor [Ponticaulis sp.]RPG18209.1 MAG: TonB-dependent receptor [Hyphomonadaceae bacterium TMED125]HBJ94705.1 TonB-dependent receptor [Hyphomonadaceae bacterium]|tara:strand:+ start:19655 stop:22315 length:2661 start_codon:yes stop_codon:yes gene_type:complete
MGQRKNKFLMTSVIAMAMGAALFAPASFAQEDEEAVQENVIVTGVRGQPRTVTDSPVPVDVLSSEELENVPFTDANDIIRTLVPSYSLSRQPISDGGTFIRPAQLRGMPTDKTLVLVNGHRRHRAALVQIGGSGTQGPDIATIPAIALANVQVLRDGAAALYGSDAIAGVINFILKDDAEGATITAETGQYYEGDGFQFVTAANFGVPLGENGFANFSIERSTSDATSRGAEYCESWACVDPNDPRFLTGGSFDTNIAGYDPATFAAGLPDANIGFGDVVQPWGQPNSEALRGFVNAGYDLDEYTSLYAFASYSKSSADGSFFYRYPGNGTIENLRLQDGSVWSPLSFFPGGFTPRFFGDVIDYSGVVGIEGEWFDGFSYDISGRLGHNEIQYTLANTVNPSLGNMSPTRFNPGDLINEEFQLQADFAYDLEFASLASPLTLAFGGSFMDESYELVGGDPASFAAGPYATQDPWGFCNAGAPTAAGLAVIANGSSLNCADSSDPVYQVVGVGSNGFPGYSPAFSGEYTRDSYAVYADLSGDVTDRLFLQGALRFEDYSDFDSELVWKVAGQFDLTETMGLRGSVGTGFRAPTPGQQGTTNVSTRLPNGFPVATGLFPAGGTIAQALDAVPLSPEKSTNYTLGWTGSFDDFSLTVDFYRIELEDRVNAISTLDVSNDPALADPTDPNDPYDNYLALVNAGVVGAESIGGVFYFQNAFDTITQGVDIVGTYNTSFTEASTTSFTASVNYNKTEFDGSAPGFNAEDTFDFENGQPEWRGVFSVLHEAGPWTFLGRASYYGEYDNSDSGGGQTVNSLVQNFSPEVMVDVEASYQISDAVRLSLGARNVFDEYPDAADPAIGDSCCGRVYRSDSVVDWQGGYYYLKLRADL